MGQHCRPIFTTRATPLFHAKMRAYLRITTKPMVVSGPATDLQWELTGLLADKPGGLKMVWVARPNLTCLFRQPGLACFEQLRILIPVVDSGSSLTPLHGFCTSCSALFLAKIP